MPPSSPQKFLTLGMIIVGLGFGVWWYAGFSLEFMRFFAAEPGVVETPADTVESTTESIAGIISCSPETQTVQIGSPAEIVASGGGPFQWMAPGASSDSANTTSILNVSYDSAGTKQVVVQGPRGEGSGILDSVVCTVIVTE